MNRIIYILIFFWFFNHRAEGQEYYQNSEKLQIDFAEYLFNTRQYEYASQEYLRLSFSFPENAYLKKRSLESFRLNENYQTGLYFSNVFLTEPDTSFAGYYFEIVKLKLLSDEKILSIETDLQFSKFESFYNECMLLDLMINEDWEKVHENADKISASGLFQFTSGTPDEYYLSPVLAATLSAVIPGSGKIYAKRWKDGLSSLLFVGLSGIQSYRAFNKTGIKSAYGWIMGGLSFGFYIGNIYGSYHAVADHNRKLNEAYKNRITDYYISHY